MSINIRPPAIEELRPHISVIGVGGAGGNAIANMINAEMEGVNFVVANTDAQALNISIAEHHIQMGTDITHGLGAGGRTEVGRAAALESLAEIERALEGAHMCFIAAGMGGGTGGGAAPVIAKAARDKGLLTVGVVTKPFHFEGMRRMRSAEASIEELQREVDTLIVIPNQNLFLVADAETTFKEAFSLADEVMQKGVRSITDLMVLPGLINLDFADVRSVMGEMGKAMMGTGEGSGENRALEAAERAIANPLLDGISMQGAKGVIISIIGGDDMKLLEVDEAANHIRDLVDPNANIIWGSAFNPDLQGKIRISVVATGIEQSAEQAEIAVRPISLAASRGPIRPAIVTPASAREPVFQPAVEPEPVGAATEERPVANDLDLDDLAEDTVSTDDEVAMASDASATNVPPSPGDALGLKLERVDEQETAEASRIDGQDDLLLNGNPLAEENAPVSSLVSERRDGVTLGAGGRAPVVGNTLFERMTSLSRKVKPSVAELSVDEDEDDGSTINKRRFLGRQTS